MRVPAFLSSLRRRFLRRETGSDVARAGAKPRGRALPRVEALERFMLLSGSTISGFVYNDANNNGIRDPGELPFANNTIQLFNGAGAVVGTTVTDANGFYVFNVDQTINTAPKTLTQTARVDTNPTNFNLPVQPAINQFDPALGILTSVDVINNGTITSTIVAQNLDPALPAQISGTVAGTLTLTGPGLSLSTPVSLDAGTQTAPPLGTVTFPKAGDPPLVATGTSTITLTDPAVLASYIGTGQVIPGLSVTATAESGVTSDRNLNVQVTTTGSDIVTVVYRYIPNNSLQPGPYKIVQPVEPPGTLNGRQSSGGVVLPPNNPATGVPDFIPVALGATNSTDNNFGELLPAALSGFNYNDLNNNGLKEPGEAGFPNEPMILSGTNDLGPITPITQLTGPDGSYSFTNLRPGNYTVTEPNAPTGFVQGLKALNNVVIPGSNTVTSVSGIAPPQGVTIPNNNFGNIAAPCPAPTVTNIERFGIHMQGNRIVLTFSGALDPATAQDLNNYRLVGPGRNGQIGPNNFTIIPIRSATYDPATNTVTLVPARNLNVHQQFYLIVRGTNGGITAFCGTLLDGNNDGIPGGNYTHVIDRSILAGFNDKRGNPVTVVNGQIPRGVFGLPPSASAPFYPKPARGLAPSLVDRVLARGVNAAVARPNTVKIPTAGVNAAKVKAVAPMSARSASAIDQLLSTQANLGKRYF